MTNEELSEAIKYASDRLRTIGTAEPQHGSFQFHLEQLLEEQRRRAKSGAAEVSE